MTKTKTVKFICIENEMAIKVANIIITIVIKKIIIIIMMIMRK